jgi:uncharacterized Rmd1/YagE family protein
LTSSAQLLSFVNDKKILAAKAGAGSGAGGHATSSNTSAAVTGPSVQSPRPRKLTPIAKAKAQASASRALREQLQVTGQQNTAEVVVPAEQPAASLEGGITREHVVSGDKNKVSSAPRQIRDVYAYATAEEYNFDVLTNSGRLPDGWRLIQDGEVIYIPQWPANRKSSSAADPATPSASSSPAIAGVGEAFIFRSGSYVTWGVTADQSRKFARSVIRGRPHQGGSAEIDAYSGMGDEAMEYVIAEDQITRVVGDVIVIGMQPRAEEELEGNYVDASASNGEPEEPDWTPLLARLAFSQGLCRSARLSVQEAALNAYLEEVADMPARLEAEGKVPLPRRQVIRKMGTLLRLRQQANLDTENFLDDPEMYWENSELEHHYDSICLALDIETRFKAYNEKLDHGENLLGVLRALLTESSTHRMELIIIYLIAFEVCLALISHEYIPSPARVYDFVTGGVAADDQTALVTKPSEVSRPTTTTGYIPGWLKSLLPASYRQQQPVAV